MIAPVTPRKERERLVEYLSERSSGWGGRLRRDRRKRGGRLPYAACGEALNVTVSATISPSGLRW
jgi:hypothetical protein